LEAIHKTGFNSFDEMGSERGTGGLAIPSNWGRKDPFNFNPGQWSLDFGWFFSFSIQPFYRRLPMAGFIKI